MAENNKEGNMKEQNSYGLREAEEGVAGPGQDDSSSSRYNPVQSIKRYFSEKSMKKREEEEHWEELGNEDLIEKRRGPCNPIGIFWEGSRDSQGCDPAPSNRVKEIFRHIIMNLGAYGEDLDGLTKAIKEHDPMFDPKGVVEQNKPTVAGACPPYFIYVDHGRREVNMYIRGLNLMHRYDYETLLNNRKGEKKFKEGYVHHGMSISAEWGVTNVGPVLRRHLVVNKGYRLNIVGHSLGAGVATLLTVFLIEKIEVLGGISSDSIQCFAIAPPRVLSLNLAKKYASNVNSVIYQDDFLPRVSTSTVKKLFLFTMALTAPIVCIFWIKQVFTKVEDDGRRLYPPGKIYHFVYKQVGRAGHRPIRAREINSAEKRFERLVLSASGTINNHYILPFAKHVKSYNWPEGLKDEWLTSVLSTA